MALIPTIGRSPVDIESRYEFLEKIGSGSFATVYRARDLELGREVAVKQIHEEYMAQPAKLESFWAEAQLLASLQHPNIVTIYDLYRDRGWLILELMQTNLADRMQGRPMDVRAAKTTVAHCLRALKYLHERGITHGDVKPSNMMIDARKRIKIGDFGLARRASDEEGSLLKGTTKYMAPEVVSDEFGEIGPASDLYSLGFSAYQLLCGENFEQLFPGLSAFGRNKQVAWMMWHAAPDRRVPEIARVLNGVPEDLAGVVDKLVKKPQAERYATAQQALDDLEVDQKVVKEVTGGPQETTEDPGRRKRLLLLGGALFVSVLLSAAMLFMPSGEDPTKNVPDVVVFREFYPKTNEIKVTDVNGPGARSIPFERQPVLVLRQLGAADESILLRDLKDGDRLEFDRSRDELKIVVSRPIRTRGVILELNPSSDSPSLLITPKDRSFPEDLDLRVPESARILRNGKAATLGDLKVDDEIDVWHLNELGNRPGRIADRIEVTQPEPDAVGVIEEIDSDERTMTLVGEDRTRVALSIDPEATITLNDRNVVTEVGLADLKPGDSVTAKRDAVVREILATRDKFEAEGIVVGVAPGLDLVTVQRTEGEPLKLLVGPKTEIRIGSTPARLADLRRDDKVRVKYGENEAGTTRSASSLLVDRPKRSDRWVILVANARYTGGGVVQLPYVLADARDLALVLRERYSVMDDRCSLFTDVTRTQIETAFEKQVHEIPADAELIVYLGGHAFLEEGRPYFGGVDLDTDRVAGTGVPLEWIVEKMEASAARSKLLLLDTGHAGSDEHAQPATGAMAAMTSGRESTFVLASCSRGERAYASAEGKHGLFVHALAKAYAGAADADVDYDRDVAVNVSPRELETFTRDDLASNAPPQTPQLLTPGS